MVAADGMAMVFDVPAGSAADARTLAALGEAVGGFKITDSGQLVRTGVRERLSGGVFAATPDASPIAQAVARWFVTAPNLRSISPFLPMSMRRYAQWCKEHQMPCSPAEWAAR